MAEGRLEAQWGQTSAVLAYVHNSNPNIKALIGPDEVNPFSIGQQDDRDVCTKIGDLGARFAKPKGRK